MRRSTAVSITALTVVGLSLSSFFMRDTFHYALFFDGERSDWDLMHFRKEVALDIAQGKIDSSDEIVRKRYLEIADANPGTRAEVASLLLVSQHWPNHSESQDVFEMLLESAKTTNIGDWGRGLEETRPRHSNYDLEPEWWQPLAAILIERVRRQPEHPKAAHLLCEIAVALHPDSDVASVSDEFIQIADLIQQRYASSPDIANFCEVAGNLGNSASWSKPFEPHVRHILEVNENRFVRLSAHFALASIIRSQGATRQDEARQLYEEFLASFDGNTPHRAQGIEQANRQETEQIIKIMDRHGLGMPAPETHGFDLDGNAISLKDYRGRVVLVSFWATWCRPCLEAIPHEVALLEAFGESDFAIFGVNVDKDIEKAKAAVQEHGMAWKSLRARQEGTSHAMDWTVAGYPTFYLLDKQGVIANSWNGLPPESELRDLIRELIDFNGSK